MKAWLFLFLLIYTLYKKAFVIVYFRTYSGDFISYSTNGSISNNFYPSKNSKSSLQTNILLIYVTMCIGVEKCFYFKYRGHYIYFLNI